MTRQQRQDQVARDFAAPPPRRASAAAVTALAAAPLCPAGVTSGAAAAAAPADYRGVSFPVVYDAAGRCVSGPRLAADDVVQPGQALTATAHIYYQQARSTSPPGTGRLPVRVSFTFRDCLNRPTKLDLPDVVQAIYQPQLSNAELQGWVEAHPNPVSLAFTAPREGCVRQPDDSGWGRWALNTTVTVTTTVVGGAASDSITGVAVNGMAPETGIGGNDLQPYRGDPVNTVTGAYTEAATDLENEGDGVRLAVTRSYASDDKVVGPLGPGWTMPWFAQATSANSGAKVTVRSETGAQLVFVRTGTGYEPPAGTRAALAAISGGGWTLTEPDHHRLTFDTAGKLTAISDGAGRTMTLTYTGTALTSVRDSGGATATLTYTAGRLTAVALTDGRRVDYTYAGGRLETATASGAGKLAYTYDTAGRLASRINSLNKTEIRSVYDAAGRVIEQFDALNKKTVFTYFADHTDVTDPRGGIWTDVHAGNAVEGTYDPLGALTQVDRDDAFNPAALTLPDKSRLISTFDAAERPVKVARPATETGTPNTLGYDAAGNVASYTHPDGGGVTGFTYNAQRQLATAKNPLGAVTTFTYGTGGVLASATTPTGRKTTFGYDGAGRRIRVATAGGGLTTLAYDPAGRVIEQREYRKPVDLAAGRAMTTSSVFGAGFEARLVADGKPTTRWSSAFSDPQWLTVDLGAAQTVDRVRLFWEAAYATAYQIQVSTNNSSWTTVSSTTTGRGGEEIVSFTPVTARYVRMNGTARATTAGYSLWDFEVYNTATRDFDATYTQYDTAGRVVEERRRGPGPEPGDGYRDSSFTTNSYNTAGQLVATRQARTIPTDFAAGRPVAASSIFGAGYTAALAVDGRPETRWSSAVADPQWLSVDLGSARTVDRVRLSWEAAYATAYQIQISTDNASWTTVSTTTTGRGGEEIVAFTPVTARYVRLHGTKRAIAAGYSLWDFEVTNTADVAWDVTTYTYDDAGRVKDVVAPGGRKTTNTYDDNGNLRSTTDPAGATTSHTYDAANRLHTEVSPRGNADGADPAAFTTSYTYDTNGYPDTVTDPTGAVTDHDYNNQGLLLTTTDGLHRKTSYTYDKNGNRLTITDPLKRVTKLTYDKANRLATSTDPKGRTTTYGYGADGNLTSVTRPSGAKTSYLYDLDGRRVGEVDARGNAPGGKPSDYTTFTAYDAAGRPTLVTDPLGGQTRTAYDPDGNTLTVTNPVQLTTRYKHDATGRLTSVTTPDDAVTGYRYDEAGFLDRRTDANQHVTDFTHDRAGRLKTITDPLERTVTYDYDPAGNRTTVINARGTTSTATFDARNLPRTVTHTDATPDVTYTYDDARQIKTVTDAAGTRTFGYDDAGQLKTADMPGGGTFRYGYDDNGNIDARTYPDGRATGYTFTLDNRLETQTTDGATTRFGYDHAGNLTTTTLPSGNGHVETRTYDRAGQLAAIDSVASAGTVLNRFALDLDPAGRPATVTTARAGQPTQVRTFGYDTGGRLKTVCIDPAAGADCPGGALTAYTYDKVGSLRTSGVRGGPTTTHTYDDADQLATTVTGATTTAYGYDRDGNQTKAGADTFTYDAHNRLITATTGDDTFTYTYDATANRLTTRRNDAVVRTSVWDTNNPITRLATDTDAAGIVTDHTYDPVGQPLGQRTGSSTNYLHHDWLGSVTDVTDSAGVHQRRTSYDAYGTATTTALTPNAPADTFGFTGAINDPHLQGRLNFPARTYTPATGAFTTRDPHPYPLAKPYTTAYGYAEGAPSYLTDPTGECAILCTVIAGAVIGGVIGGAAYAWEHRNDDKFDWGGLAAASGKGALIGAGAGLLMPASGLAVTGALGLEGGAAAATTIGVNAAVGAGYTYAVNTAQCIPTTPTDLFLGAIGGALAGVGGAISGGSKSAWALDKFERGLAIEAKLGGNLPKNFPTIDKFANGRATSIKSIDLTAKTYQKAGNLKSLLKRYVDSVAGFAQTRPVSLSGVTIRPADVAIRELEIAIPKGAATASQRQVLRDIQAYGPTVKVTVKITEVS